jgi:hypothetical protein
MVTRLGSGRWQSVYLGLLNGVPREGTEMVRAYLGRRPSRDEHVAALRAAHSLADLGAVELAYNTGKPGPPRLVLAKVPGAAAHPRPLVRWVTGSDAAAGTDAEALPIGSDRRLDAVWQAFGTDPAYAEEIAAAGRKLGREVGSGDRGTAAEVRGPVEVRDVGVKARSSHGPQFPTVK